MYKSRPSISVGGRSGLRLPGGHLIKGRDRPVAAGRAVRVQGPGSERNGRLNDAVLATASGACWLLAAHASSIDNLHLAGLDRRRGTQRGLLLIWHRDSRKTPADVYRGRTRRVMNVWKSGTMTCAISAHRCCLWQLEPARDRTASEMIATDARSRCERKTLRDSCGARASVGSEHFPATPVNINEV